MRLSGRASVIGVGLALVGALTGAPPSEAGSTTSADTPWLMDVSVLSPTDAWAVGFHNLFVVTTSIWHWDGQTWTEVASPEPGAQENMLYGVEAVSATDVWAVGRYGDDYSKANTLIEHWDGSAWSVVPSPNSAQQGSQDALFSVSAAAPDDVWAAGYAGSGPYTQLIEHWNGKRWRTVDAATDSDQFAGVSTVSANDAWAVGGGNIEHWDGASWNVAAAPPAGSGLSDVSSTSPTDVWAVGSTSSGTLAEHWDGATWTVVPSPNGAGHRNDLHGVIAITPTDAWAVGEKLLHFRMSPLLAHWDGTEWSLVRPPGGPSSGVHLRAVDASSGQDVWAVGYSPYGGPLPIDHWDGRHWRASTSQP